MIANEASRSVAGLLHEAAERITSCSASPTETIPDWASWYADGLLDHSELANLLGARPVRSHLVHALVRLDREYAAESTSEPLEDCTLQRLTAEFGA